MDFGAVALEGLVYCSDNIHTNNNNIASFFPSPTTTTAANSHSLVTTAATSTTTSSDPDAKPKWCGSGLFGKQERSATASEDDLRELKMPRTSYDDFSLSKAALLFQNQQQNSQRSYSASTTSTSLLRSNTSLHSDGQHMLSFSSPNSQTAPTVAYFPHTSTASYGRNTGYGSAGFNAASMHGVKGPFTPSQWMELEHQALIYKYITANTPIPSNLLIPIRKALESAAFSTFPGAHIRHSPYGWGAFHMGFSGSSDPEPGRCRRTDGKKWRCSRDAVADQKYCERHMNRGRHRSRKPVEGQTGHSASGGGPTNTTAKLMPMSSSTLPAAMTAGRGASNSLSHLHRQLNGMQPGVPNLSASSQLNNRSFLNKGNVSQKNQENQYSILKQRNPSAELSRSEFGFVCSDSLLNPLHENTSYVNSRSYCSSKDLNDREAKSQNSLRQFMDDWPHSDRTQLSISIPVAASSDFMSSTSSPSNEKLALSPLRLSRELDPTQMGLGMGARGNEANHRQANWIPISWETSMGGPLGEVLHSTINSAGESTNASPLNLMTEGWDSSPRMALSPTGVLQKTAFGSLSNSSAGSSPRTENNLLGSTLMNSSSLSAM